MISELPSNWSIKKIGEIGDVIGGGTPSTKNDAYYGGDVSWITPKDLSNHNFMFIEKGNKNITKLGLEKSSAKLMPEGTVLFSSRAPIGYVAIAKNELSTNQGFKSVICDERIVNNKFIYYSLKFYKDAIESVASGSTFKEVSGKVLKEFEIPIPPLKEQDKTAKILFSIDQKIEINQKMNQTLEEIGQAIFKHWFVHFEFPNEEGKPYKSSGGEMVDSELGKIPNGWEVAKLSDICSKVIDGTHDSPSPEDEGFYLVTGRHIVNGFIDFSKCYKISSEEHQKVMKRSRPEKGDTIFSNIGTLGTATYVDQDFEFSIKNVALFKPLKPIYSSFIYLYFISPETVRLMENSSSGTTQRFFSLKFLRGWELIKPSDDILLEFSDVINPILKMRTSLYAQNENLSQIRDSILPKLMSGKIRLGSEMFENR